MQICKGDSEPRGRPTAPTRRVPCLHYPTDNMPSLSLHTLNLRLVVNMSEPAAAPAPAK
jgi:hypothetical protein